ncbi:site-2 protease family protein [Poriferisphaera sp. WC338]|uniref:site-2 protease family protein n=1 Tax=Poriferisphaera sp. WC338 TaxID=3425129 RepID=UPI003D81A330
MFGEGFIAFIELVIGFGFLIFVHELGHFMVAKWVGIKCPQFAIGFGTAMLSWRKGIGLRTGSTEKEYEKRVMAKLNESGVLKNETDEPTREQIDEAAESIGLGETEYRLNYLPLGGYVKMLGQEDLDPNAQSKDPRSYNNKPIWARACVISAGVVMNMIFGFIFFIIAFQMGVQFPPPVVGGTIPGMPAATTYAQGHEGDAAYKGLQIGDRIVDIDGKPTEDMTDLRIAAALGKAGVPLTLTVDRPDVKDQLTFKITPEPNQRAEGLLGVGVFPPFDTKLGTIFKDSQAYNDGLRPNMTLIDINGKPIENYAQAHRMINDLKGANATFTFKGKDEKTLSLPLQGLPIMVASEDQPSNLIGLVPAIEVTGFTENSILKEAKAQEGDIFVQLGGVSWPSHRQVLETVQKSGDKPLKVSVLRDGEVVSLGEVTPKDGKLGFSLSPAIDSQIVAQTIEGSPAAALKLTPGSKIVKINDQPIANWSQMQALLGGLKTNDDQPAHVSITYQLAVANNPEETSTVSVPSETITKIAAAGWVLPDGLNFQTLFVPVVAKNPIVAGKLGLEKTYQFVQQTYITLLRLFQGSVQVSNLRGPVGIVDVGTQAAQKGFSWLLFFLGLISVNLAVINFLPLPIVDGGHIVFLIIEKIKGSPASPAVQIGAMWVGLALIGTIFVVVTYHDIYRLFSGS